jgi:sirohydrochlorin cobaltochelatase
LTKRGYFYQSTYTSRYPRIGVGVQKSDKAILVVTFGTSFQHARAAFDIFDADVKSRHPDYTVRWAFTSGMVRAILKERGETVDSPNDALLRLAGEGFRTIVVQSLHTIPGEEFHKLVRSVRLFESRIGSRGEDIRIGMPLRGSFDDLDSTADALLATEMVHRNNDESIVFMGHGSGTHAADLLYMALASVLRRKDQMAFLGTVEGHPTFDDVAQSCAAARCTRARLIPFMSVAGDHALNDMAGSGDDSWKSMFCARGIVCESILQGTLENRLIRDIWLDHLETAIAGTARRPDRQHGGISV